MSIAPLKTLTTTVLYYTITDAYYVDNDNRPIINLHDRDDEVCDAIDQRVLATLDITGGVSPTTNTVSGNGATWVVVRNGAGDYTITHNFGFTTYSIVGSCIDTTPYLFFCYNISANAFSIKTASLSGTLTDTRFALTMSKF